MHSILRHVLPVLILLLGLPVTSPFVNAIEVNGVNDQYRSLIQTLVSERIEPVVALLPDKQRYRLEHVSISITDNLSPSAMALALDETPPRVLINSRFISDLSVYTEAYQVRELTGQTEFVEHYFHYYLNEISQGTPHRDILRPAAWASLELSDQIRIASLQAPIFEGVLLDVILHELGHHAENAFYSYRASHAIKEDNEELADVWADSIKTNYFKEVDPLGRLISIAFLFERDRWVILSKNNSYPRMLPWVANKLPGLCEDSALRVKAFCLRLQDDISNYMTHRIARAYSTRVEQGEDFARFPLAQILLAKNNFVDACNYFNESLIYGQVSRAAIYVGWCYQKGFLENSPPDAEVLAMANFRGGIGYGYSDKVMVEHFF